MRRWAIVGTGALGGYYGGLLARAGNEVHFLMRSDANQAKRDGLQVESKNGDFVIHPVNAYENVQRMPACDFIIVALKSTQNHFLAELLPPLIKDSTIAVVLQNGLHVEAATEAVIGPGRVLGGCCFLCSNKVGPSHIRHLDYGEILIGSYCGLDGNSPEVPREIVDEVVLTFSKAGVPIQFVPSLQQARWKKLMWNIPFNGLSVILNATTKQLMGDKAGRNLVERLMREVRSAALACGEDIPESHIDYLIDHTEKMVPYDSSMRLDYLGSRPMELQAIFANPLEAARNAGFEARQVQTLFDQLSFLQSRSL